MKIVYISCIAVALYGCAATEPMFKVETKEVNVLVTQPYPPILILPRPTLEIEKLPTSPAPGTVALAYQVTVAQLIAFVEQLETQIQGVNDASAPSTITH